MHLNAGELRAYQDQELSRPDRERVRAHLSECSQCREQAELLLRRSEQVGERLADLATRPGESQPTRAAWARFQALKSEKENTPMLKKIFARAYRPVWVGLALVAILAIALAFPPVQAIANSFLGLFRVQQISVVQVNPGDLPEQLGSSSQFEYIISNDVQFEEGGPPITVSSAEEASAQTGIPVRLPAQIQGSQTLKVQPGGRATFNVDLPRAQALLNDIGRSDIRLPRELDGATVTLEIPTGVLAQYGQCDYDREAARDAGYDPDDRSVPQPPECTTLLQVPSPTIDAPEGLNLPQIGEAFLQVLGMSPEEAASFAANVDWTTTLVVPIPRYGTEYRSVTVDGVEGTLIEQNLGRQERQYMLMWVRDGIVYALTGPGDGDTALTIASSLK